MESTKNGPSDEQMAAAKARLDRATKSGKSAEVVKSVDEQRAAASLNDGAAPDDGTQEGDAGAEPVASTVWWITYLPQHGDFDTTKVDDVVLTAGEAVRVDAATRGHVVNNCRNNPWFFCSQDENETAPNSPKAARLAEIEAEIDTELRKAKDPKAMAAALRAKADLFDPPA